MIFLCLPVNCYGYVAANVGVDSFTRYITDRRGFFEMFTMTFGCTIIGDVYEVCILHIRCLMFANCNSCCDASVFSVGWGCFGCASANLSDLDAQAQ